MLSREPMPALRPFIRTLWASVAAPHGVAVRTVREHVLPTGMMHLVVRLSPEPIAVFDDATRRELGHAVIGGARSTYYVKDVSAPSAAVGAQLRPGAAALLFGVPADALAEAHTPLADHWGREATTLRDRLGSEASLAARLDAFEAYLAHRLPRVGGIHPAVAVALERAGDEAVAVAVERSGYSHRAFVAMFRRTVGLAPKAFARIVRFQRVTRDLTCSERSLARVALDAGYADQAHFSREFAAIAGISPARYRALRVRARNHVPIVGG